MEDRPKKAEVEVPIKKAQIQQVKNDSSSIHSGPATRKLAREFGINLSDVTGSGPKGRILKEDLHIYVSKVIISTGIKTELLYVLGKAKYRSAKIR